MTRWAYALLGALLMTGAARASDIDLLDTLHANHTITDAQYARLKQQAETKAAGGKKGPAKPHGDSFAGLHLPNIDGYLQVDVPLSVGSDSRLGSRTDLRRFYVHLYDTIAPGWSYTTTFGYFNGATYFVGGDVTYSGFKRLAITGGYFKEPFSLSYLTSPKNLLFAERPLPVMALDPGKKIGVALRTHGARWSLSGGVFGGGYDQTASSPKSAGRWGESVRATITPWYSHRGLWEFGASYAWREADSDHSATFGYLPESFTVGTKLANTPPITDVSWFSTADAETLLHAGPFALQGEYLLTHVDRDGAAALTLPGWYAQASWSITGEQRHFSPATGTLGGLTPAHTISAGGWGAWEVAVRYSALDLNNADISGGFERNATVGVNWYPETPLKLMLDAIRVLPVDGGSHAHTATTIVMLRLQAAY